MLEPRGPFLENEEISSVLATPVPSLHGLSSLTPLQGKVSAIHTSAFFHLFSEDQQLALAHRLASLLSPQTGSIIFGQHGSRPEKGFRTEGSSKVRIAAAHAVGAPVTDYAMFCHSTESWKEMWEKDVFGGNGGAGEKRIKADAELVQVQRKDLLDHTLASASTKFYVMNWSVTRL